MTGMIFVLLFSPVIPVLTETNTANLKMVSKVVNPDVFLEVTAVKMLLHPAHINPIEINLTLTATTEKDGRRVELRWREGVEMEKLKKNMQQMQK